MKLVTEPYVTQASLWPRSGQHILAQFDEDSIVVYQAYKPSIGRFAAEHGHFGGEFGLGRMSWIKPNFLWRPARYRPSASSGTRITTRPAHLSSAGRSSSASVVTCFDSTRASRSSESRTSPSSSGSSERTSRRAPTTDS